MSILATLPVLAASTFFLVLVVPLVRHWRRHGTLAFVHATDPIQAFVHGCFAATLLAYGAFAGLVTRVPPEALGTLDPGVLVQGLGLSIGLAGLLVVILAQAQMGRSWRIGIDSGTELVTGGLFQYSRNPIYLGMLLLVVGIALIAPSGWTIVGAVLAYVLVGFQARAEEAHLLAEHGETYARWASQVGRFLPGVGRLPAPEPEQ